MLYNPSAFSSQHHHLRRRCRNARCGMRLREPTDNARIAFCCRNCREIFYRNRCAVCESHLPPGPSNRTVCWRAKCRAELRKFPLTYRTTKDVERPRRSADKTGTKSGPKAGRAWRVVAGPVPAEINLRLPLHPELVARLERAHAFYYEQREKARRQAERRALIKRRHPPVNVLGGYRFPGAPVIDLTPIATPTWSMPSRWTPSPTAVDCPDIPKFLRRNPATVHFHRKHGRHHVLIETEVSAMKDKTFARAFDKALTALGRPDALLVRQNGNGARAAAFEV
jgi:hypothetical protein